MTTQRFADPREARAAFLACGQEWDKFLTPAELATPIDPASWGGKATIGDWVSDGATVRDIRTIFWAIQGE